MAKAKKPAGKPARRGGVPARRSAPNDAIALLKADHRQVENWFEQFDSSRSDSRKEELAQKICQALQVHTQIEAEIFYPAFLQATQEEDIHHEAEVEHAGAKKLIAEIESTGADDDHFDARVRVLSEMIKHHVKEEEKRDGMFAKARQSDMDLGEIGERLASRKQELMGSEDNSDDGDTARGPRGSAGGRKQEAALTRAARRFGS